MARAGRRLHRHSRDHALYRPAARRHGEGDRGARLSWPRPLEPSAALPRLSNPRDLHLSQRAQGAGDDRLRQRHYDLYFRHRGRRHRADEARRLWRDLRCGEGGLRAKDRGLRWQDHGRLAARAAADLALHHAGARLGPRALHVSAFDDGHSRGPRRPVDPCQCGRPARLFRGARSDRDDGAHGACRRHQGCQSAGCGAAVVLGHLSRVGSRALLSQRSPSAHWCRPR